MDETKDQLADQILDGVKRRLGKTWELLEESEKQTVRLVTMDVAALHLQALVTPHTPAAQDKLLHEKAQINAQLLNLAAMESAIVSDAIWTTLQKLIQVGVTVAFAAV